MWRSTHQVAPDCLFSRRRSTYCLLAIAARASVSLGRSTQNGGEGEGEGDAPAGLRGLPPVARSLDVRDVDSHSRSHRWRISQLAVDGLTLRPSHGYLVTSGFAPATPSSHCAPCTSPALPTAPRLPAVPNRGVRLVTEITSASVHRARMMGDGRPGRGSSLMAQSDAATLAVQGAANLHVCAPVGLLRSSIAELGITSRMDTSADGVGWIQAQVRRLDHVARPPWIIAPFASGCGAEFDRRGQSSDLRLRLPYTQNLEFTAPLVLISTIFRTPVSACTVEP
ncbi:hypothetical protein DFH09DRAFT_1457506 [Mycena vulgaris]|nr:hypothetical protein DFH09DRAFT_1457506 [Mycena vulgaris]